MELIVVVFDVLQSRFSPHGEGGRDGEGGLERRSRNREELKNHRNSSIMSQSE